MLKMHVLHVFGLATIMVFWGCASEDRTTPEAAKDASIAIHEDGRTANDALATANRALARDPENAEAYFQLGIAYSELDSVGHAYSAFMRSAEIDSEYQRLAAANIERNFNRHYERGRDAERAQNYDVAVTSYIKAASADPRRWEAHYQVAMCYIVVGEDDKAPTSLKMALERSDPGNRARIEKELSRLQ